MNLIEVNSAEFYAKLYAAELNQADIMPAIVNDWDEVNGYKSDWKDRRSGALFGKSQSGNCHGSGEGKKFWILSA